MKLRYFDSTVLDRLRNDITENLGNYRDKSYEWTSEYEFRESQFEIDFSEDQVGFLKVDPGYEYDSVNSVELFKRLSGLTAKQASSESFWCCICHTVPKFYEYACVRWCSKDIKENTIRERFFGQTKKALVVKNALARLWWGTFLSVDSSNEYDKYALTRVLWKYQTRFQDFMDTINSHSKVRTLGILEALKIRDENEELYLVENDGRNNSDFRSLNRYLNHYSLVAPLDFLKKEQIRDLALDFFKKRRERLKG